MATIRLPLDFKEFLKLLNAHRVEYLLVGGYAVGYYGYPRATADLALWIACHSENAEKLVAVLGKFGFGISQLSADIFLQENEIIRMGVPPMRIELLTTLSGVQFEACYSERVIDIIDEVEVQIIALENLKLNKRAAGRHKDLDDLEHL